MLGKRDLILLTTVYATMAVGIAFPGSGRLFQPYLTLMIMIFLFLSFLNIRITAVWKAIRSSWSFVLYLTFLKMVVLPISVWWVFSLLLPEYALSALLLAGVSTGVVAPFISGLVRANSPLVLVLVVITSLMAPFSLPFLVNLLSGQSLNISVGSMIRMLATVVLVPLVMVELLDWKFSRMLDRIRNRRFPLTVGFLAVVNLAVFSKYSQFFRNQPATILTATLVAFLLAALFLVLGLVTLWKADLEDQLASAIGMANMNNVLVLVFASRFFGPLEPTVAAMYLIPFYFVIVPLRAFRVRRERSR